jgi:hypothetical protein
MDGTEQCHTSPGRANAACVSRSFRRGNGPFEGPRDAKAPGFAGGWLLAKLTATSLLAAGARSAAKTRYNSLRHGVHLPSTVFGTIFGGVESHET